MLLIKVFFLFVLFFDFGVKYFGVAVGQFLTYTVSPLCSILNDNLNYSNCYILSVIKFWNPKYVVFGYPISEYYNNSLILDKIDFLVFFLRCNFCCEIIFVNENLSTWSVRRNYILKEHSIKTFLTINALSAVILGEQWFSDNFF